LVNRGTMGVNSLPKTVTRRRRGCDLNPGPSAPESSTLTTRLPSQPRFGIHALFSGDTWPVGVTLRRKCDMSPHTILTDQSDAVCNSYNHTATRKISANFDPHKRGVAEN